MKSNKLVKIDSKLSKYSDDDFNMFYENIVNGSECIVLDRGINTFDIYGEITKLELKLFLLNKNNNRVVEFLYRCINEGISFIDFLIVNNDDLKTFLLDFINIRYLNKDEETLKLIDNFNEKDKVFSLIDKEVYKRKLQFSKESKSIPISEFRKR